MSQGYTVTLESGETRPVTQDEENRLVRWRISTFWVMLLGYVGYYLCRKNLPAAFPLLTEAFGFSNAELGLIASFSEIAYAGGKFINGPLGDKIGGRKIFLIGMLGAIIFNIIFAMSSTLTMFIVVWCVCRYFLSMGWGGLTKTIGNWYPPERNGTVMGFISINFQFGGVVASLFAGFLVLMGVGWKGIFLYPAAALGLVFVWSYFSSKYDPKDILPGVNFGRSITGKKQLADFGDEQSMQVSQIIKTLLSLKIYRQVLLFSFLTTLLRSVFFFWTPKLLVDMGMGPANAIFKSALFPLLGAVGTVLLGWYTDKHVKNGDRARPMWIMLLGLVVCLTIIAVMTSTGGMSNSLLVILIGLSGFFLLGPYSMSSGCLTLDIAGPKAAGSATGMIDGIGYVGGAIAAFGAGAVSDHLGWPQVFQVLAVCAVLSTISAYFMSRYFRSQNNAPAKQN